YSVCHIISVSQRLSFAIRLPSTVAPSVYTLSLHDALPILVRNADGSMPDGAQEAIDRFHQHGSHDAATTKKSGKQTGTQAETHRDRKSTRLNSSHVKISYAVFCLKKKLCTKAPPARLPS